jgi:hypothetical protein
MVAHVEDLSDTADPAVNLGNVDSAPFVRGLQILRDQEEDVQH